jgi:hypothetical protein
LVSCPTDKTNFCSDFRPSTFSKTDFNSQFSSRDFLLDFSAMKLQFQFPKISPSRPESLKDGQASAQGGVWTTSPRRPVHLRVGQSRFSVVVGGKNPGTARRILASLIGSSSVLKVRERTWGGARMHPNFPLDNVSQIRYISSMSNPMSFRLSDTALTLLDRLCSALGLKRSGVLELALRELAKKHDVRG